MAKKMNKWKIATIILFLIFCGLLVFTIYQNQIINFYGMKISKSNLNVISDITKGFSRNILCDMEKDKCLIFNLARWK